MLKLRKRMAQGQAMVEGTVCTVLVIAGLLIGMIFVTNTILLAMYKEKVAFVTQATARYATGLDKDWFGMRRDRLSNSALQDTVSSFFKRKLTQTGISVPANVTVERRVVGNKLYVVVKSITDPAGIIAIPLFCPTVKFSEVACSVVGDTTPPAVLGITFESSTKADAAGMGASMYLPAFGPGFNTAGKSVYISGPTNYYAVGINQGVTDFEGPRVLDRPRD
jgi:hypothetical protein